MYESDANKLKQKLATEQEKLNKVENLKILAPVDLYNNLYARLDNIVDLKTKAEEARANSDRPEEKEEGDAAAAQS